MKVTWLIVIKKTMMFASISILPPRNQEMTYPGLLETVKAPALDFLINARQMEDTSTTNTSLNIVA